MCHLKTEAHNKETSRRGIQIDDRVRQKNLKEKESSDKSGEGENNRRILEGKLF